MFDGFVNPALAAGVALASVPLVIHLLNRQRHRPMAWAAMQFVLEAYRRTRRRARVENFLLLLLRMAGVALLALAAARPYTGSDGPLAALTESRRDVVLVLDGSASTRYRENVESVFERVVARARELALDLDAGRGDTVRLLLAGQYPRLLSWRSPNEALSLLGTLDEPTDEPLDLAAALGEVVRFAEEDAAGSGKSSLEVRVLTDLQRRSFAPADGVAAGAGGDGGGIGSRTAAAGDGPGDAGEPLVLADELDRLEELGVRVYVEDLGPADATPPNVGVREIELAAGLLAPGLPVEVQVAVTNHGGRPRSDVRVTLSVDGEKRPHRRIERLGARATERATFSVQFATPGEHVLTAAVDADRYDADDVRTRVVTVPPPVRALLVDGAPAPELEQDEVGFVAAVLQPPDPEVVDEDARPFQPRVVLESDLHAPDLDLSDFDVVLLANVARVSDRTARELEEWVAGGGALIASMGDQVDGPAWNQRLFRADGSGLLPAELDRTVAVASRREAYYRVREFDQLHPALAFFADERWQPLLTEVPVYEFTATRSLHENARVLARLDDHDQSPLLVERPYDRGSVFLWTTTLDNAWTRLPESPRTLVPLVHELLRYAGRPRASARNVGVGQPLRAEVTAFPRELKLVRPDGSRRLLDAEPQSAGANVWSLPTVTETDRAGLYTIETVGAGEIAFAVQVDPDEGDLDRLGAAELDALHPALRLVARDAQSASTAPEAPDRGELWRWLAGACLVALVLESLWAAWIGRSRAGAGRPDAPSAPAATAAPGSDPFRGGAS